MYIKEASNAVYFLHHTPDRLPIDKNIFGWDLLTLLSLARAGGGLHDVLEIEIRMLSNHEDQRLNKYFLKSKFQPTSKNTPAKSKWR